MYAVVRLNPNALLRLDEYIYIYVYETKDKRVLKYIGK